MSHVNILKYGVSSPADTSPLQALKRDGYEPEDILAVIGKSEGRLYPFCGGYHADDPGNGCVNDFSRTLSTHVWEPLIPKAAVTIFSGGTEGVLSPHVTFIVRESKPTGLRAVVGRSREYRPEEIGTLDQAVNVTMSVKEMLKESKISVPQVHLVLIKCPLLTSAKVEAIKAASRVPVTTDTYESMAKSRYASAVGIACALFEFPKNRTVDEVIRSGEIGGIWSSKASCSSGAELEDCHILILASDETPGSLRIRSTFMKDAIDARPILEILDQVKSEKGTVVQTFAKAEADPTGTIRGTRHTMNTDSDIHSTRHARAAVGGLIAGLTGDTQVYVSGGAEGQGPPGGGSLCVVYRVPA